MYLPIKLSDTAQATLTSVINYIDSINTIGAGEKWYNRFKKKLLRYTFAKKYPLCRIKDFAVNGYSCISINDWVIIFKIENDTFTIQYIIYGSLLY